MTSQKPPAAAPHELKLMLLLYVVLLGILSYLASDTVTALQGATRIFMPMFFL